MRLYLLSEDVATGYAKSPLEKCIFILFVIYH